MALKIGDEKTQFNKTFVYVGGGKWQLKPSATSTVEKQAELLTELENKSDLAETQPVSVASLPLPSGAATAAKQDLLLTELEKKADLTETQPVSLATLPTAIDLTSNAIVTVTFLHNRTHAGVHFFYADSVEIGSGVSQDYMLTTPDTTKRMHMSFDISGSAITQVQLYESSDKTGTTLQTTYNSNRNSLNTPDLIIHKGVSGGTTDGTLIYQFKSGSAAGASRDGATAEADHEILLKQNTKYIFRVTSGTNANLTNFQLAWYEHTSLYVP